MERDVCGAEKRSVSPPAAEEEPGGLGSVIGPDDAGSSVAL